MANRTDKASGKKRARARAGPQGTPNAIDRIRGPQAGGPVDVTALSLAELAELLGVSLQAVKAHADDGAPMGADGRVNLVEFAA